MSKSLNGPWLIPDKEPWITRRSMPAKLPSEMGGLSCSEGIRRVKLRFTRIGIRRISKVVTTTS